MKTTRFIFQIIPLYHPQNTMCLIWFVHLGSVLPLGSHHLGISHTAGSWRNANDNRKNCKTPTVVGSIPEAP